MRPPKANAGRDAKFLKSMQVNQFWPAKAESAQPGLERPEEEERKPRYPVQIGLELEGLMAVDFILRLAAIAFVVGVFIYAFVINL